MSTEDFSCPLIYQKIVAIKRELRPVPKSGTNDFHGYKFRPVESVIDMLAPLEAKHGVFMTSEVTEHERTEGRNDKNKTVFNVLLNVTYTWWAEDGSSVSTQARGEGNATDDKATSKAHSASYKTAVCSIFCIPYGRPDIENDSIEVMDDGRYISNFEVDLQATSDPKKLTEFLQGIEREKDPLKRVCKNLLWKRCQELGLAYNDQTRSFFRPPPPKQKDLTLSADQSQIPNPAKRRPEDPAPPPENAFVGSKHKDATG